MSDLVRKLSRGKHRVVLDRYENSKKLMEHASRGLVLVKFPDTVGGTELGITVDADFLASSSEQLESGRGKVRISGKLNLDRVDVRCVADIDLESMSGQGHLIPLVH